MKYTILGFSQSKAIENDLDFTDLTLLRYFIDFKDTGKMSTLFQENKIYYWFKYDGFISEYPILSIKNDTVYRRMKKLVDKGFLDHTTYKVGGTFSYYNVTPKIMLLLSDSIPEGYGNKSGGGTDLKPEQNNPSTKEYPSTNNPIKKKKETDFDIIINSYTNNEELKNNIYEFIKMRKGIKAAITSTGLKRMLSQLDKLSNNDSEKIQILDKSIMNSWRGIFALKEGDKNNVSGFNKQNNSQEPQYDFSCFQ